MRNQRQRTRTFCHSNEIGVETKEEWVSSLMSATCLEMITGTDWSERHGTAGNGPDSPDCKKVTFEQDGFVFLWEWQRRIKPVFCTKLVFSRQTDILNVRVISSYVKVRWISTLSNIFTRKNYHKISLFRCSKKIDAWIIAIFSVFMMDS
jgi:hypothetical protein